MVDGVGGRVLGGIMSEICRWVGARDNERLGELASFCSGRVTGWADKLVHEQLGGSRIS